MTGKPANHRLMFFDFDLVVLSFETLQMLNWFMCFLWCIFWYHFEDYTGQLLAFSHCYSLLWCSLWLDVV